jgi:hypothetical protein
MIELKKILCSPVASLQHVQNVQCTPKKGNFGLILCSLKQFFSKNTLAHIDFLFLHPRKFYPNDATDVHVHGNGFSIGNGHSIGNAHGNGYVSVTVSHGVLVFVTSRHASVTSRLHDSNVIFTVTFTNNRYYLF